MKRKLKMLKQLFLIVIIFNIILFLESNYTKSLSVETTLENEKDTESIFTLYKEDGETFEPIEGTKFIITDLEGNQAVGTDGQIVGELENINGIDYYVLTTGKDGIIKANLPQGFYKAIEVSANEAYMLEEKEENRTYYFEIGLSNFNLPEWLNGVRGYTWDEIKSTISNYTGGVIAARIHFRIFT